MMNMKSLTNHKCHHFSDIPTSVIVINVYVDLLISLMRLQIRNK